VSDARISMSDVEEKLADIIVTQLDLPRNAITPATRLREDLGVDSIDAVELAVSIEEIFNIEIDSGVAVSIATVGQLIDLIKSKRQGPKLTGWR
jgi:acyl carrier protein